MEVWTPIDDKVGEKMAQWVHPNDPLGCRSACQVVILGFRNSALISAVSGGRVSVAAGRVQCISKRICSVGAMSQSCAVSAMVL